MEWTNVHFCLRDDLLPMANFRNIMETFEVGKLLRRHMNNCSYVAAETSAHPSMTGGWFRGTRVRECAAWRVPDLNEFAIGVGQWLTTCIANVCRKKTLSIVRKSLQRLADLFDWIMCLLDAMASICPTMVFVGYEINKCFRQCAPGIYECLLDERDNIWAIAHMPRWVITS